MTPKVSVLLPCWNSEHYLQAALESLSSQTFSDFEIIAIEDHSSDSTLAILESFAKKDSRLKVLTNPAKGVSSALNFGLKHCQGQYVARMDSDDICSPDRLLRQVEFLDQNPNVFLVGTWFEIFNDQGIASINRPSQNPLVIAYKYSFQSEMGHPTVMFRNGSGLPQTFQYPERIAEDFFLFSKLSPKVRFQNIPNVLLKYRMHLKNKSEVEKETMLKALKEFSGEYFLNLGLDSKNSSDWMNFHHLKKVPLGSLPPIWKLYWNLSFKIFANLNGSTAEKMAYWRLTGLDFGSKFLKQFYRRLFDKS